MQLDKTQKQIVRATSDFIRGEFKKEVIDEIVENDRFPKEIWKKAVELGLIGMHFPEHLSGQDMGLFENVLVVQGLCRGDSSVGGCLSMVGYGTELLIQSASQELQEKWVPRVAEGDILASLAYREPEQGSDYTRSETRAQKDGEDYLISGIKTFAVNAGEKAGFYIVLCRTGSEDTPPSKEFSLFLVEKDRPGLTVSDVGSRLGRRLMDVGRIELNQVRVPASNMVGRENDGLASLDTFFNLSRINTAAQAVGIAQGAFDRALAHVKQREQFRQKIVDFQITRQKIAEMAMKIDAAQLLTYQAAQQYDSSQKANARSSSTAKAFATRAAFEVCDEAIQLYGGYGYMQEYEVERFYRDAKMAELFDGGKVMQKEIIASELVRKGL
jgi:alkylation response protein AidB-like acyl-CoA dehydrogenase